MPGELDRTMISSSANAGNAANVATLQSAAGKRTYCTGLTIIMGGATAATNVTATVTGALGGTLNYAIDVPLGVNAAPVIIVREFSPALMASGLNTNIIGTLPAGGAGNVVASIEMTGYNLTEP